MERLTRKIAGSVALPLIPMDIKNKEDLEIYHKVRKQYEENTIKLAEYEDLEDKLNGISVKQVVDGFINTVKNQTNEEYEHGRILTNEEADKWNEYKQLEEQGLLLRLPCKVGDIIYVNGILGVGEAEEYKIIRADYHSNLATKRSEFYIEALLVSDPENAIGFYDKEIGKTVFLTQTEAEQKLKEMERD